MTDFSLLHPIEISKPQIETNLKDTATMTTYWNTKIPAIKGSFKNAIKNAPIVNWLDMGYNIAISLPLSYLCCIDVDMHGEDGLKAFKDLENLFGELGFTYTEDTPTGSGKHFFFRLDGLNDDLKNCDLAEGVEFKVNGFIVCAPSCYKGKRYQVINGVNPDGTYHFAKLNEKWAKFINEKAKRVVKKYEKKNSGTQQNSIIINRVPKFDKLISRCRFLANIFEQSALIKEPVWFSMVNMLTRNTNTDEFIHYLSQGHPNYTHEETDRKIAESRSYGKHRGCFYIATNHYKYCQGCPKAEQIMRRYNNGR